MGIEGEIERKRIIPVFRAQAGHIRFTKGDVFYSYNNFVVGKGVCEVIYWLGLIAYNAMLYYSEPGSLVT